MTRKHRIIALVGVALIGIAIVTMLVGAFLTELRALLMNISFITFLGAAAILVFLSIIRKQAEQEKQDTPPDAPQ